MVNLTTNFNDIISNLNQYLYSIKNLVLSFDNTNEQITIDPKYVQSFIITKDFIKCKSPSMMMSIMFQKNVYMKIIPNINDIVISFSLYVYNAGMVKTKEDLSKAVSVYDPTQLTKISDFRLKPINNENLNTIQENLESQETNDSNNAKTPNDMFPITFYLYDFENIKKYKIAKSYIIKGGGINDCVYRALKDRHFKNILYSSSPSNASKTHIMMYGDLGVNLQCLNSYYNMYNSPMILFMDVDRIYVMQLSDVGSVYTDGESPNVVIYLDNLDNALNKRSGSYINLDEGMYGLYINSMVLTDLDSSVDYAVGGKYKSVNAKTGEIYESSITNADTDNEKYIRVTTDMDNKKIEWSMSCGRRTTTLTLDNIDIRMVTPNKLFTVVSNSKTYPKEYKLDSTFYLSGSVIKFAKYGDNLLSARTQLMLTQIFK